MFKRIIDAILNGAYVVLHIFLTVWWFSFIREIFSTPFSNEPNSGSREIEVYFSPEEIVFILLFVFLIVCIFSMLHMLLIALPSPMLSNDALKWQILLPLSLASKKITYIYKHAAKFCHSFWPV